MHPSATAVAATIGELHGEIVPSYTSCGTMGGQYGQAMECSAVGAVHRIPVGIDILFPLAKGGWESIKLQVIGSLDSDCGSNSPVCIVGGS